VAIRKGFDAIKPGEDYEPLADVARGPPMQTFLDSRQLAWDEILDREAPATAA
jgi:hypothetical protein